MSEQDTQQGAGSRQVYHLRPGLNLHIGEFTPREPAKMHFEAGSPSLRFTFLREGQGYMDWRVSTGTAVTKKAIPIERSSSVYFYPELEGTIFFPAGYRQSHFSIRIAPSLLDAFLGGRFERTPYDLQAIFEGCNTLDFYHSGPLSPVMEAVIHQLLDCPYSGPLGLIYREGKAIELVAHKLAQIASSSYAAPESARMHSDDIERVRYARDILATNLEDPPGLFDLARAVGTTHTQLNRGFRKMYGTSVFGYLRRMRLEEARSFLEKGRMNVTEAALAVGYNSISSFSRAFSEHFGSSPLSFLKKR